MSTSNEVDELMEDNHSKQTKLQKFLKTIDDHTMNQIDKYLMHIDPSIASDRNNKSEKIRLWHDLTIIQKFKMHEKQINSRGRKRIIQKLCNELKEEMNFSAATINERIQKKLTNISKQTILNHIQEGIDFTFDTKRKLMPMTPRSRKANHCSDRGEMSFQDSSSHNEFKIQKSVQIIHSSASQSSKSVQEVQVPEKVPTRKQRKRKIIRQQQGQDELEYKSQTNENVMQNNIFNALSDNQSDYEYTYQFTNQMIRPGSEYIDELSEKVLQAMKEFYIGFKIDTTLQKSNNVRIEDEASMHIGGVVEAQANNHWNSEIQVQQIDEQNNIQKQRNKESQRKQNVLNLGNETSATKPNSQQLKYFNNQQECRMHPSNQQANKEPKWFQQQDQYLASIANNNNLEAAARQIQILRKFRSPASIIARINNLGLSRANIMRLLFDQSIG